MLLDVSQPVDEASAAFPGDQPFECGWSLRLDQGASVDLSSVRTSPHVGTHVDAPRHVLRGGAGVGALPLDAFIGQAHVVDARGHAQLDVDLLRGLDLHAAPRVLFRTRERNDPHAFDPRFPLLTPTALDHLAAHRVRLVGIDAPSYDPVDSEELPVHRRLATAGIVNLENLALDRAPAGRHELLAAPIRWTDMDAAPVRAILRR